MNDDEILTDGAKHLRERETPCEFCFYHFDQYELGSYGCPNCEGEGLDDTPTSDPTFLKDQND